MDSKDAAAAGPRSGGAQYIELVGKAIDVLETLSRSPASLNLREISTKTGLGKSTTHRIVHSLARHGYVEQEYPGGPFRLGMKLLLTARGVHVGRSLVDVARPYCRRLAGTFNENVYIAVLREGHAFFMDAQEACSDPPAIVPPGVDAHFHSTAAGKAIAAFAPALVVARLVKRLSRKPTAIGTRLQGTEIEAEWQKIRQLGYAVNKEAPPAGAMFIAAPFFDAPGGVCGAVSLGLPKLRYSEKSGGRIVKELKVCCDSISRALKASGYLHDKPW